MDAPTFIHTTVLLEETVDAVFTSPDGTYVDGTFGRGGHSRALLAKLGPQGRPWWPSWRRRLRAKVWPRC